MNGTIIRQQRAMGTFNKQELLKKMLLEGNVSLLFRPHANTPKHSVAHNTRLLFPTCDFNLLQVNSIQQIGVFDGFKRPRRRRQAWCALYGVAVDAVAQSTTTSTASDDAGVQHQIRLDVRRSFHFDVCLGWSQQARNTRLSALSSVLSEVFPDADAFPFYVQGSHDVASVLLLSTGQAAATTLLGVLVQSQLKGYVQPDMAIASSLLSLLMHLLRESDPQLHEYLHSQPSLPPFALPWILTLFAHSCNHFKSVARLFDLFLCSHPLMPLYIACALLSHFSADLRAIDDEGELYMALQKLPNRMPDGVSVNVIISSAIELYRQLHPMRLLALAGKADRALLAERWPELMMWSSVCPDPIAENGSWRLAIGWCCSRGATSASEAAARGALLSFRPAALAATASRRQKNQVAQAYPGGGWASSYLPTAVVMLFVAIAVAALLQNWHRDWRR